MKKGFLVALIVGVTLLASGFLLPGSGNAGVQINIGLPPLVLPAPPPMVVIPGTYVYYPPDVNVDIFFYHGHWYRPHGGGWFISGGYNGPWRPVGAERVPRAVLRLPASYRQGPGYRPIPYGHVQRNWRAWERDRHWDHEGRGEHHGREHREHGHGHGHDRERY